MLEHPTQYHMNQKARLVLEGMGNGSNMVKGGGIVGGSVPPGGGGGSSVSAVVGGGGGGTKSLSVLGLHGSAPPNIYGFGNTASVSSLHLESSAGPSSAASLTSGGSENPLEQLDIDGDTFGSVFVSYKLGFLLVVKTVVIAVV
jgi:hypothetical protein